MAWTCGYALTTTRDAAKFFYDLLGPEKKIVSDEGIKQMENFTMPDKGGVRVWIGKAMIWKGRVGLDLGLSLRISDYGLGFPPCVALALP